MSILEGIILGLIQGLTEFLPVSSSGHLALGRAIFNNPALAESPLLFDVAVHTATLLAIIVYFRAEVLKLIRGFIITLLAVSKTFRPHPDSPAAADRRLFFYVVIASVPTAIIGLLLKDVIGRELQHPVPVGLMLCLTGVILFMTRSRRGEGRPLKAMKPLDLIIKPFTGAVKHFFCDTLNLLDGAAAVVMAVLSLALLFVVLTGMTKLLKGFVVGRLEHIIDHYLFRYAILSYVLGMMATAIVQSSSVTTILIVPR